MMSLVQWVRFSWDLTALPATAPTLEDCYQFGLAKASDEEALHEAMTRSYTAEVAWSTQLDDRLALLDLLIKDRLADGTADFLILRHGSRIIAGSALIDDPEASEQLASGVCVMDEYRNRGLGAYLLYESLAKLKASGLKSASVVTKVGVTADRYLYGKFGGKSKPYTPAEPTVK